MFGGEEQAGDGAGTVSIFMNDVRVASNIVSVSGRHELGTRIPDEVRKTVLAEGGRYYGTDYIAGNWHLTAYEPIRSRLGRIIGILYVGIPENPFLAVRTSMMLTFLLVAGIGVLVVLVITYFITRSMILPLEEMVKASNRIAAGDFDHSVAIQSNDEIGILADSFNKMSASIKTMKLELEWGHAPKGEQRTRSGRRQTRAQSEKLA